MILPHSPTLLSTSTGPLPERIRLLKMRPLGFQSMETEEFLPLQATTGDYADAVFVLLAHMEEARPGQVS